MELLYEIAPMARKHIAEIARLEQACFSKPWSEKGLAAELDNPTAHFIVAVTGGAVAGYAGMHGVCGEGYIANVAVFPEHRGQGVGRILVRELLSYAKREQFAFLSLEVRPSNLPAVALYRSEGFQEAGVRRNFYDCPQEDGVILTHWF